MKTVTSLRSVSLFSPPSLRPHFYPPPRHSAPPLSLFFLSTLLLLFFFSCFFLNPWCISSLALCLYLHIYITAFPFIYKYICIYVLLTRAHAHTHCDSCALPVSRHIWLQEEKNSRLRSRTEPSGCCGGGGAATKHSAGLVLSHNPGPDPVSGPKSRRSAPSAGSEPV